jgi:hypothetical protein
MDRITEFVVFRSHENMKAVANVNRSQGQHSVDDRSVEYLLRLRVTLITTSCVLKHRSPFALRLP